MPRLEHYVAEVTVSVVLRTAEAGEVATYSVRRVTPERASSSFSAEDVIESGLVAATAAHRALAAGVDNAEGRRLK